MTTWRKLMVAMLPTYPKLTRACQLYWRGHEITFDGSKPDSHSHPAEEDCDSPCLCCWDSVESSDGVFVTLPCDVADVLASRGITMAMILEAIESGRGIDVDTLPSPIPAMKPIHERTRPSWSFTPYAWDQLPESVREEYAA